jgi:hypothetical protein
VTVHVDELSSDVTVEPERGPAVASGSNGETPLPTEELRALLARLARDTTRTQSEGFGD